MKKMWNFKDDFFDFCDTQLDDRMVPVYVIEPAELRELMYNAKDFTVDTGEDFDIAIDKLIAEALK